MGGIKCVLIPMVVNVNLNNYLITTDSYILRNDLSAGRGSREAAGKTVSWDGHTKTVYLNYIVRNCSQTLHCNGLRAFLFCDTVKINQFITLSYSNAGKKTTIGLIKGR